MICSLAFEVFSLAPLGTRPEDRSWGVGGLGGCLFAGKAKGVRSVLGCWGWGSSPTSLLPPSPPTPVQPPPRSLAVACRPAPRPGPWVREAEACVHGVPSSHPPPAKDWEVACLNAAPFFTPALPERKGEPMHAPACSLVLGVRAWRAALQWLGGLHSQPNTTKGP